MARDAIISVIRAVTGTGQEHLFLARSVHTAIGLAALGDIKADFIRKARHETGEDGNRWPRLSPEYLAYGRRFGSGEQAALKKAAGLDGRNRFAPGRNKGLLTGAQLKQWRKIYGSTLSRLAASKPLGEAKAIAAGHAWNVLKASGAKTKLEVFGNREHEILRDTGVLLASLSPGQLETIGGEYQPVENQIFDLVASGVIVGTNVPYAGVHNNGSKKKTGRGSGIPERRFLPKDHAPTIWVQRWAKAGTRATAAAIRFVFSGAVA